ncbi:hypothetical protein SGLAM104S_02491 [Streptomyces glaucescens]
MRSTRCIPLGETEDHPGAEVEDALGDLSLRPGEVEEDGDPGHQGLGDLTGVREHVDPQHHEPPSGLRLRFRKRAVVHRGRPCVAAPKRHDLGEPFPLLIGDVDEREC